MEIIQLKVFKKKCDSLNYVDPVEVYMYYEIKVAKKLPHPDYQIPVRAKTMLYEEFAETTCECTEDEVDDIARSVEAIKASEYKKFLDDWDPYQKVCREEQWDDINWDSCNKINDEQGVCLITQKPVEKTGDFLLRLNYWSQETYVLKSTLEKWWIENGTDPMTNEDLTFNDLQTKLK